MKYLLDTNTCIYAMKRWSAVIGRMQALSPDDVSISAVTLAELWFGARKSSRPERTRESVDTFLRPIAVLPFDRAAAEAYSEVRWTLERRGRPIGERDLMISAIARAGSLTVVTHNVREFRRVPNLNVEDWV